MSKAAHTPGPWKLRRAEHSWEYDFILHAGPHIIAWSIPRADRSNTLKKSEHIANAKLIAEAPELLDALENIAAGNTNPDEMVEIARAAVKKATGRKQ